jgi:hypothetical protein
MLPKPAHRAHQHRPPEVAYRERWFKVIGVGCAVALGSTIIRSFATYAPTAANLLTDVGALLILVGWWRVVMQDPEDRRDLRKLWGWARYGLILLGASFVIGMIQAG